VTGVTATGLAKRFGDRDAVTGLTFEVRPGEVFGLLGPNGAGKTTTVRMLTGLLTPSEGEATVCGLSVRTGGEALRRTVGLLTEQPGLYDRLTARENLTFFIKLNGLEGDAAWKRASTYLARFGLGGRENDAVGTFSKGMRQKLAIVRALVHDPKVVFLDEPTSGLDPEAARAVRDAVAELAQEGRTILLCSHNLAEVERLCARVAVVKGRLLKVASISELRRVGHALEVHVEGEASRFRSALEALRPVSAVSCEGGRMRVVLEATDQVPRVVTALVGAGARIHAVTPTTRPLEEVYLELVREQRG
jgi:ABC-2 type transport system ATP-binding protein